MSKQRQRPKSTSIRDNSEKRLLEKIGRKIHRDLHDQDKPIEWLSFEAETGRATIRAIFNGESNCGILTLNRLAKSLGYKDVTEFLNTI